MERFKLPLLPDSGSFGSARSSLSFVLDDAWDELNDELADADKLLCVMLLMLDVFDESEVLMLLLLVTFVPGKGCDTFELATVVAGSLGLFVGLFIWLTLSLSSWIL